MTATSPSVGRLTGRTLARYRFDQRLGSGPRAEVYLGEQLALKRKVALKVLRPDRAARPVARSAFLAAARGAAALIHPNILPIFDVLVADNQVFVASEYAAFPSMKTLLAMQSYWSFQECCQLALHVLDAIRALHATGRAHGNLWPGNLFQMDEGRYRLSDFFHEPPIPPDPLADTRLPYLAPEARIGVETKPPVDYFALGALLSLAALGKEPEPGREYATQIWPSPTRDWPDAFEPLVRRLLDPDPRKRAPAGACGLVLEFEALAAKGRELGGASAVAPRKDLPPMNRRKYPRLAVDQAASVTLPSLSAERENTILLRLKDIGENGVFVATDRPLAPGTVTTVEFELGGGPLIRALGVVRWTALPPADPGMGIQFVEVTQAERNQLRGYVDPREKTVWSEGLPMTQAHLAVLKRLPDKWDAPPTPRAELRDETGLADEILTDVLADMAAVDLAHEGPDGVAFHRPPPEQCASLETLLRDL